MIFSTPASAIWLKSFRSAFFSGFFAGFFVGFFMSRACHEPHAMSTCQDFKRYHYPNFVFVKQRFQNPMLVPLAACCQCSFPEKEHGRASRPWHLRGSEIASKA